MKRRKDREKHKPFSKYRARPIAGAKQRRAEMEAFYSHYENFFISYRCVSKRVHSDHYPGRHPSMAYALNNKSFVDREVLHLLDISGWLLQDVQVSNNTKNNVRIWKVTTYSLNFGIQKSQKEFDYIRPRPLEERNLGKPWLRRQSASIADKLLWMIFEQGSSVPGDEWEETDPTSSHKVPKSTKVLSSSFSELERQSEKKNQRFGSYWHTLRHWERSSTKTEKISCRGNNAPTECYRNFIQH